MQQETISRAEHSWMNPPNVLQEAIHYSFIKFCFYCFFLSGTNFFVHYAMKVKKNYQHGLDAGPVEFQFLQPRGCLTNPVRTVTFFRVISKKPGLISRNNFVKKIFACIGHRNNILVRCYSIFPLLRCQGVRNKTCTQLSRSQILFQNLNNWSWGCSKILLSFLM